MMLKCARQSAAMNRTDRHEARWPWIMTTALVLTLLRLKRIAVPVRAIAHLARVVNRLLWLAHVRALLILLPASDVIDRCTVWLHSLQSAWSVAFSGAREVCMAVTLSPAALAWRDPDCKRCSKPESMAVTLVVLMLHCYLRARVDVPPNAPDTLEQRCKAYLGDTDDMCHQLVGCLGSWIGLHAEGRAQSGVLHSWASAVGP